MRLLVGASVLAVSGLSLLALPGCGSDASTGDTSDSSGEGGSGAAGGGGVGASGGTGGAPCVPETEACDGVDNNCDDVVDEGCACSDGDTQECYSGRPDTQGIGECLAGTQTCDTSGTWGACVGEVLPAAEECNHLDDDCNGVSDDQGETTCGVGACQATVAVCADGMPGECVPGLPTVETCDGIDNDCDQLTDETFPDQGLVCDTGVPGVCGPGVLGCVAAVQTCIANEMPSVEDCDSLDNDCNGEVDDNIPGTGSACSTGVPGICAMGTVSCQNGIIDCYPVTPPGPELCDLVDNDCDEQVDEGNPEGGAVCDTGLIGACQAGTITCDTMTGDLACIQDVPSGAEQCNAIDDDCDGTVDEGTTLGENFDSGPNGFVLGPGWVVAPWAGYMSPQGLGYGNGTSFPLSSSPSVASKTLNIPAGGGTLSFRYRYLSNDCCGYDAFVVKLGGVAIVSLTAGTPGAPGWQLVNFTIPQSMWGTSQLFEVSFQTIDSVANSGYGNVDEVNIPCPTAPP